jgi:hypothetical protein
MTEEQTTDYAIKLDIFEGPLDLLLYLIKKNEIDIYNIPVALITQQYLEYLNIIKSLNLDLAGEYLVMASTLIHIPPLVACAGRTNRRRSGRRSARRTGPPAAGIPDVQGSRHGVVTSTAPGTGRV